MQAKRQCIPSFIPPVLVFVYIGTRMKQKEQQEAAGGQTVNLVKIIPWFIGGFLALAVLNSVGFIPADISALMKSANKFLMATALADIWLRGLM